MAIVRKLKHAPLEIEAAHTEVDATYALVKDREGELYLQIDTYGSGSRKMLRKKSQSVRFSYEALCQLLELIDQHFIRKGQRVLKDDSELP